MLRISRVAPGGMGFHVLNRGVDRQRLLSRPSDYEAFEDVVQVQESLEQIPMRILQRLCNAKSRALCLMARTCRGFSRVNAEF